MTPFRDKIAQMLDDWIIDLCNFLIIHEHEIASRHDNMGMLQNVFKAIMGKEPRRCKP